MRLCKINGYILMSDIGRLCQETQDSTPHQDILLSSVQPWSSQLTAL